MYDYFAVSIKTLAPFERKVGRCAKEYVCKIIWYDYHHIAVSIKTLAPFERGKCVCVLIKSYLCLVDACVPARAIFFVSKLQQQRLTSCCRGCH